MKKFLAAAAATVALGWAGTANAAPIVFTTAGTASGQAVSGKATFDFDTAGKLYLTLENLTSPTSYTSQELDGFSFTLTSSLGLALVNVSPVTIVDCASDNSLPCVSGTGTSPYGWLLSGSGVTSTIAPNGYKPYAIINPNYTVPDSGNGNLANPPHNPFLVGPVVFEFNVTGNTSGIGVSATTFLWGTVPDRTTGTCVGECVPCQGDNCGDDSTPVPEPASMLLLGVGLLGLAAKARRRR